MMSITKRSEEQEEFSNLKIENSLRSAGVDDKTAREISDGVAYREGIRTSEVREHVEEKLTRHSRKLARCYNTYEKPVRGRR